MPEQFVPEADSNERVAMLAAAGDSDAMCQLFDHYADFVLRRVQLRCARGDYATAEDISQEVWVKAVKSIAQYVPTREGSFVAWLGRISDNVAIDHFRWHGRRPSTPTADMLAMDCASTDAGPEALALANEFRRILAHEIAKLPRKQRAVVENRFFQNLTIKEVSALLGLSVESVKRAQHDGIASLRKRLPEVVRIPSGTGDVSVIGPLSDFLPAD